MNTAKDVMTKEVASIPPEATVAEAMAKMSEKNVTSLLVEKSHPADSYGFMSQRDVITKVIAKGGNPDKLKVADIMSKPIISVPPDTSLQDCAMLMERAGIRRVLVYDGQKVIGIVSSTDIFRATL